MLITASCKLTSLQYGHKLKEVTRQDTAGVLNRVLIIFYGKIVIGLFTNKSIFKDNNWYTQFFFL